MISSETIKITSNQPGPTVAIFAGVHGNETAGVFALQKLLPNLAVTRGTLYVAFANPPAIEANVRMIEKNLNRCFYEGNDGDSYEDERARELMKILDECDALLDLHMFYDPTSKPFVICEDNALDLAKKFDVGIISTNWTKVEPGGTDGYMYLQNKIGICVECGPIEKAAEYTDFSIKTIYQFLKYFEMTDKPVAYSDSAKRLIRADHAVHKNSENFVLEPGLFDFQKLEAGQVIAKDDETIYSGKENECIIFPHYKARVGEEAYIIGCELEQS